MTASQIVTAASQPYFEPKGGKSWWPFSRAGKEQPSKVQPASGCVRCCSTGTKEELSCLSSYTERAWPISKPKGGKSWWPFSRAGKEQPSKAQPALGCVHCCNTR